MRVNWHIPVTHRDYNRMPASVWIRCLQLLPYLRELGIESTVNGEATDAEAADAEIAVFVRMHDARALELARAAKAHGQRVVLDLVVNYLDFADVPFVGQPVTTQHQEQVLRMLAVVDAVTCSSSAIATRTAQVHEAVHYIPDSIDFRHFHFTKAAEDFDRQPLRAIWSGAPNKVDELTPILPLLRARRMPLTVITSSGHLPTYVRHALGRGGLPYRVALWRYASFPKRILEGEICLVHRAVDNSYNQGHSFYKVAVFMAEGVPALASPVPSYAEIIQDRENGGIIADNSVDAWGAALDAILADRNLLAEWSRKSVATVAPYSAQRVAEQYLQLFEKVCA